MEDVKELSPKIPDVDKILDDLRSVALVDGQITIEEQILITTVVTNVMAYSSILEKAREDGIITDEEMNQLFEQRMKVMENAYHVARDDNKLSDDEKALLKEVCTIVMKLNET